MSGPDFAGLVAARRDGWSNQALEDASGVKRNTWQKWRRPTPGREQRFFPEPETIRGFAVGLDVSDTEVLHAVARTLGMDVGCAGSEHDLVIRGAGDLPPTALFALESMARFMHEQAAREADAKAAAAGGQ